MFPVDLFSLNAVADVQPSSVTLERESKNAMVIFKIALLFPTYIWLGFAGLLILYILAYSFDIFILGIQLL
jgi:hypothetical protein